LDDTGFIAKLNRLFPRYSEYLQPAGFVTIFSRAINQSLSVEKFHFYQLNCHVRLQVLRSTLR
jgi:hypothetical protein